MIKSELISSVARNDSFRAARVATPISILRPTSVIMPSHQRLHYRFAVVKTKKFSSRISSFSAPVFYFLKGKENFLFCRSVRTSQSWCSRQNEVVLFFNIKYCVIREFSNIPSAFASGITARATRAYILGVCGFASWRTHTSGWGKEGILPPASRSSSQLYRNIFSSVLISI